ncbi:MAG: hypothetical protein JW815_01595, partial [Candidatus Bathyarchaeota archaeon]|nr:hypothetical protein [Candidatus Bathyarchaeum sp.]
MKKTVILAFCMLLLFVLVFSIIIMSIDNEVDSQRDSAFIIWGSLDYADETYMGGEPEGDASRAICDSIYSFIFDTQEYVYC